MEVIGLDCFLVQLCDNSSHDAVEGFEVKSSSIPGGNGIEGVSPLRRRFTMATGLIEPKVHDCGITVVF